MAETVTSVQLGMATPLGDLLGHSTAEMEAEFADYKALGVQWVRTDFWWDLVKPTATGSYDWSTIDRVVDMASKYGIKVIGELNGMPSWVTPNMSTTAAQKAFGDYAAAAAAHFGDKVDYWEVFNEPNLTPISPQSYTKMLQAAYTAIKAYDFGDVVISGGLSPSPQSGNGIYGAVDYLKGMYAAGAKGYFDAVGFHPYTYPLLPENPAAWNGWQIMEDGIRGTMVANGDSALDVWITELGAPTAGGTNAMSQADQATVLKQAVALAGQSDWIGPILWYSYADKGGATNNMENWFGLVDANGGHKTMYDVYKALAGVQDTSSDKATFTSANFTGDADATLIVGNDKNNTILAGSGNDTVKGGSGDDVIVGQWGNDILYGNGGNDRFDFNNWQLFGWDTIKDFSKGDKIDLHDTDANANVAGNQDFTFIGSGWLSAAGQIGCYQNKAENYTAVCGDVTGDGVADFMIRVEGLVTFAASDFVL